MQFDKSQVKKVDTMKGRKPSKWDGLLEILKEPGDTYYFDEEEVSRASAASAATRLRNLSNKPFHSGYDVKEKKTFVRLRTPDEVLGVDDDEFDLDD